MLSKIVMIAPQVHPVLLAQRLVYHVQLAHIPVLFLATVSCAIQGRRAMPTLLHVQHVQEASMHMLAALHALNVQLESTLTTMETLLKAFLMKHVKNVYLVSSLHLELLTAKRVQ